MAVAAVEQLLAWGIESIATKLRATTDTILKRVAALGLEPRAIDRGPYLFGLTIPEPARVRIVPALAEARCFAAMRGSSLRLAPHLHTTETDIERLLTALGSQ